MSRCSRRVLAVALPLGLGLTLSGAGAALADPPDFSLVVGVPTTSYLGQSDAGSLDDRLRVAGEQLLTEPLLGLAQARNQDYAGDRFGASLLVDDLNGDGYDDVVVGAPGSAGDPVRSGAGVVYVLFGSPTGITTTGELTIPAPSGQDGDEFGSALAFGLSTTGGAPEYLYVGAPGRTVNGKASAGAVMRFKVGADGHPSYVDTITLDDALVPGDAEAGDRFGAVLATAPGDGAVVGMPDADVGAATDAGEIIHLRVSSDGAYEPAAVWDQDSPGVPGVAETGDHFGASVGAEGREVGVPGEDVGSLKDAGAVQTFVYDNPGTTGPGPAGSGRLTPGRAYTQDSKGVPGKAEAGDDFGASVVEAFLLCQESTTIAIGAPGEDVGKVRNAGSVTLIDPEDTKRCPARTIRQGDGTIPGVSEAGDHFGASLGLIPADPDHDDYETLLVGDPGENIGKDTDTGRVVRVGADLRGHVSAAFEHFWGGDATGLEFGAVLPGAYLDLLP